MRTKQVPIALPEQVRLWYQRKADQLGIPVATYVRMRLTEVYVSETRDRDTQPAAPVPATPLGASAACGAERNSLAAVSASDGPDLNNAW